jgi:hypothetical protein
MLSIVGTIIARNDEGIRSSRREVAFAIKLRRGSTQLQVLNIQ